MEIDERGRRENDEKWSNWSWECTRGHSYHSTKNNKHSTALRKHCSARDSLLRFQLHFWGIDRKEDEIYFAAYPPYTYSHSLRAEHRVCQTPRVCMSRIFICFSKPEKGQQVVFQQCLCVSNLHDYCATKRCALLHGQRHQIRLQKVVELCGTVGLTTLFVSLGLWVNPKWCKKTIRQKINVIVDKCEIWMVKT